MSDTKISALADGTAPQDTDEFVVARGSGNNKLSWAELVTAANALYDATGAAAAAQAASQPLDSDLTAIAALATTSFGRSVLTQADASALRTLAGLGALAVLGSVTESTISLSDVTTDNVSSSAHGFAPKSPADATKFLNGGATPAWSTPPGLGAVLFDSTLGANTASIDTGANGIAGGYHVLEFWFIGRTTEAIDLSSVTVTVNDDTGSNYDRPFISATDTTVTASATSNLVLTSWAFNVPGSTGETGAVASINGCLLGYDQTTFHKAGEVFLYVPDDTASNNRVRIAGIRWKNTAAITRMAVTAGSGNLLAGSRLLITGR